MSVEGEEPPNVVLLFAKDGARTYVKFASEDAAVLYLLDLFEGDRIATNNEKYNDAPNNGGKKPSVIEYGVAEIQNFLDVKLTEVIVMRQKKAGKGDELLAAAPSYELCGKEWLNETLEAFLVRNVAREDEQQDEEDDDE